MCMWHCGVQCRDRINVHDSYAITYSSTGYLFIILFAGGLVAYRKNRASDLRICVGFVFFLSR